MSNIVYHQNVICSDSSTGTNFSHDDYYPVLRTSCPADNPNHTFLATYVIGNTSENKVIIDNDTKTTHGGYHCEGFEFDINPGPDADYVDVGSISFPYDICLECAALGVDAANYGDWAAATVVPPGPIAAITSDVSSGSVLHVNTAAYVKIDMTITLVQGSTVQNVGNVIAIDLLNLTITVSGTVSESFTAGAYVTAVSNYVKNIAIRQMMKRTFGDTIEGNVLIPANSTVVIKYKNKTADAKTIVITLEYFA